MTIGIASVYNAGHWLEILERGTISYRQHQMYEGLFRTELDKCGQTLENVGTSEEKLHGLFVASCKAEANYLLGFLRDREVTSPKVFVGRIREALDAGGLTPDNIGSSGDELDKFLVPKV